MEPKFKVGDRIRVKRTFADAVEGTILTIKSGWYNAGWQFNEVAYWLREADMELIEQPVPTTGKVASDGTPETSTYYKLPAHATELRHLIAHKNMNFHVGNIFKAAYRLGEKEGIDHRYDLNKIITMAQFELEELDRAEGKL